MYPDDGSGGIASFGQTATQDPNPPAQQDLPAPKAQPVTQPEVRRATPVDPNQQYDDALSAEAKALKEHSAAAEQHAKDEAWRHQKEQEFLLNLPDQKMPTFDQVYPAPKAEPVNLGQPSKQEMMKTGLGYLAVALPLAIALGSGRRGNPLGAIKGLAEGFKSIQEGYNDKAAEASRIFKAANDAAAKNGQHQLDYYEKVMTNRKTNIEEKLRLLETYGEKSGDEEVAKKAEAGDWHAIAETYQKRAQLYNDHIKWTAENDEKIQKALGNGPEYEDYKQRLFEKDPRLPELLAAGKNDEYNRLKIKDSTTLYKWTDFLDEKQKAAEKEAKEKAKAAKYLKTHDDDEESDGESKDPAAPPDPALDSATDALAKKLRGGK